MVKQNTTQDFFLQFTHLKKNNYLQQIIILTKNKSKITETQM